jgi:hypothetical protein
MICAKIGAFFDKKDCKQLQMGQLFVPRGSETGLRQGRDKGEMSMDPI